MLRSGDGEKINERRKTKVGIEECNSVSGRAPVSGLRNGALGDSDCRTSGEVAFSWLELIRTAPKIRLQHRLRFDIRNPSRRFFYFLLFLPERLRVGRICLQGWGGAGAWSNTVLNRKVRLLWVGQTGEKRSVLLLFDVYLFVCSRS